MGSSFGITSSLKGFEMKNLTKILMVLVCCATLWNGCSGKKVNENDPQSMFKDAEDDISNDRYLLALDKMRVVKNKFSYTSFGALAQLRIGDIYFLQESYPEASSAYETFVELYPKHEKSGYAQFKAGESYYMDIPSNIARDMKSAESAIQEFTTYLKRYPTGEFTAQATEHKKDAYNRLAEKELDTAKFYLRRKKFDSARGRLEKILSQFSESTSVPKAMELLKDLPAAGTSNQ